MELLDSRRLPGANILWERPGAVVDVTARPELLPGLVEAWKLAARARLDAVGWTDQDTMVRLSRDGASLAISAPLDALYAATEVNESAWAAACAAVQGEAAPDLESEAQALRKEIGEERNPPLLRLRKDAHAHGVAFLSDDDHASIGLGTGSQTWPVNALPRPVDIDWSRVHDIPCALITGTNGKTTTGRLVAAVATAAGKVPGTSSTDGVRVGDELVDSGDWSGPGGARLVLRHPKTEVGILETARGGMLRRGLAVERCEVAAVLNVGDDHLGEWGVGSLAGLAEGKFTVTRAADTVVLNADDEHVAARGDALAKPVVWFSLSPDSPRVQKHLAAGGSAALLEGDQLIFRDGTQTEPILPVQDVPVTMGGAARYNIANALAAAAIARQLGFSLEHIRAGLRGFQNSVDDNPGRLNRFELGGLTAIVDYAHNPHGFDAVFALMQQLPAARKAVLIGQAGDREDESIRALARSTWEASPDLIVIKEMHNYLRGREPGEVPGIIEDELRRAGAQEGNFSHAATELDAVRDAFRWAQPGDLLMLLCQDERARVLEWIAALQAAHWQPGDALPPL
ncbi:MAG: Mur ligase [Planctomycetes bacterium]|nr:Mur ligase [Planctomycetota bacterium]